MIDNRERLAFLAKTIPDYEAFCKTLVIISKKSGERGYLDWNKIQRQYNAGRSPRDVILKARQVGMTTEELARDVWKFILGQGQKVVITCQSQADNAPIKKLSADVQRMLGGLEAAGLHLPYGVKTAYMWTLPSRDASLQLIEAGASEAAATKKGRAGTYTRLHITEASFYEHAELTTNGLFECVSNAADTEIVIESTPNGVGNWFHQMFTGAEAHQNGFKAHFFPWWLEKGYRVALDEGEVIVACTDREYELVNTHKIKPEQLKWYRAKVNQKGQQLVDQEFPCDSIRCFLTSGKKYFDLDGLDRLSGQIKPVLETSGNARIWAKPELWHHYAIGVDPAEGLGEDGDWSVATIWNRKTRKHMATLRSQLSAGPFAEELVKLARVYNDALIAVERNRGMAMIGAIERTGYNRIYYDADGKPGFSTNTATRPAMLEQIQHAVRDGSLVTSDAVLISEMRSFAIHPQTGKPFAPGKGKRNGISDDSIFATAGAWWVMLEPEAVDISVVGDRHFTDLGRGY